MLDSTDHTPGLYVRIGIELDDKGPVGRQKVWPIGGWCHGILLPYPVRMCDMVHALGYKHSGTEQQQS